MGEERCESLVRYLSPLCWHISGIQWEGRAWLRSSSSWVARSRWTFSGQSDRGRFCNKSSLLGLLWLGSACKQLHLDGGSNSELPEESSEQIDDSKSILGVHCRQSISSVTLPYSHNLADFFPGFNHALGSLVLRGSIKRSLLKTVSFGHFSRTHGISLFSWNQLHFPTIPQHHPFFRVQSRHSWTLPFPIFGCHWNHVNYSRRPLA